MLVFLTSTHTHTHSKDIIFMLCMCSCCWCNRCWTGWGTNLRKNQTCSSMFLTCRTTPSSGCYNRLAWSSTPRRLIITWGICACFNLLQIFKFCLLGFNIPGGSDLPEHWVQQVGISGAICRCFPTGALNCRCSTALWPTGIAKKNNNNILLIKCWCIFSTHSL